MILALIAACEVGFWVVLAAGLAVRYALGWARVGAALLLCVPLVDLVLLAATVVDLRGGATATAAHGLAAAYLGFSVAFGHQLVADLDQRVAHRFAGGPAPTRAPRTGAGRVRHEWAQWRRAALAWAVACALLVTAIVLVGDPLRTRELGTWAVTLTLALLGWLLVGPVLARLRLARAQCTHRDAGAPISGLERRVRHLKLVRSFVMRSADDARSAAIVSSTIGLAHALHLRIIAEGVETEAVLDQLTASGCDVAQGYHLGRPQPADQLTAWLTRHVAAEPPDRATMQSPAAGRTIGFTSAVSI